MSRLLSLTSAAKNPHAEATLATDFAWGSVLMLSGHVSPFCPPAAHGQVLHNGQEAEKSAKTTDLRLARCRQESSRSPALQRFLVPDTERGQCGAGRWSSPWRDSPRKRSCTRLPALRALTSEAPAGGVGPSVHLHFQMLKGAAGSLGWDFAEAPFGCYDVVDGAHSGPLSARHGAKQIASHGQGRASSARASGCPITQIERLTFRVPEYSADGIASLLANLGRQPTSPLGRLQGSSRVSWAGQPLSRFPAIPQSRPLPSSCRIADHPSPLGRPIPVRADPLRGHRGGPCPPTNDASLAWMHPDRTPQCRADHVSTNGHGCFSSSANSPRWFSSPSCPCRSPTDPACMSRLTARSVREGGASAGRHDLGGLAGTGIQLRKASLSHASESKPSRFPRVCLHDIHSPLPHRPWPSSRYAARFVLRRIASTHGRQLAGVSSHGLLLPSSPHGVYVPHNLGDRRRIRHQPRFVPLRYELQVSFMRSTTTGPRIKTTQISSASSSA